MKLKDPSLLRSQAYINGAWIDAADGRVFAVNNPADGSLIAEVADLGADSITAAIDAAVPAQKAWAATPAKTRAMILRRWYDLVIENTDDLATILTTEMGKPLAEAKGEIAYGASFIDWFGEEARRVCGDVMESPQADKRLLTFKQPIGVFGAITPWNFPIAMITRKVAPGLAAGCACVLKPAEQTPLSALALAELATRAGIPAGVMNIVTSLDAPAIGQALCADSRIRKMTFTGSTEVGKLLEAQCVPTLKKTSMELGGNAPFIVFEDADLDSAVQGALISKYRNSGQTCVCSNRILVQASVADAFVEKLVAATSALSLGNGLTDGVDLGPLVNNRAVHDVDALVKATVEAGATVALGGAPSDLGGNFYQPTILTDVTPDMAVFRNEIFGPVAPVTVFHTEKEAITLANDTEFGLASYFYTRDIGRVWRVSEALDYGIVGVNEGIISNGMAPFGGVKASGSGREGSKYGIDDYLEIKYILMGGLDR